MPSPCAFPDGHFYSPVVNVDDLRDASLWETPREVLGIDFNDASHLEILSLLFPRSIGFYAYEETAPSDDEALDRYYTQNSQFSWLDSRALSAQRLTAAISRPGVQTHQDLVFTRRQNGLVDIANGKTGGGVVCRAFPSDRTLE